MGWCRAEHGWIAITPTERSIDAAKQRRAERDAEHGNLFTQAEGENDRWVGDLAEMGFANWLNEHALKHDYHGGVDSLADFVVAGWGVGLKCRTVTASMKPSYIVNVPDEHMNRRAEAVLFFACYEEQPNRLLLLGCISRTRFQRESRPTNEGEELHAGAPSALGGCRSVTVTQLTEPADFIHQAKTTMGRASA